MKRPLFIAAVATIGLAACTQQDAALTVPFVATFGDAPIGCDQDSNSVLLTDLRFYVSDVQLITYDDEFVDVHLDPDEQWQSEDLALLDLENGIAACDNGTSLINATLRGHSKDRGYNGIQFTLGVPFDRNHGDPLKAQAPLGDSAMHWHWRGGYKFLRAGVQTEDDGYWFHLGSTACKGEVKNILSCDAPNRVVVQLRDFAPGIDSIAIDLEQLIDDATLADNVATDCSSGPAEETCATAFDALGLDFGEQQAASDQRLFRVQKRQ